MADKAVSAILSLLTFFLIAEKESKIGFPLGLARGEMHPAFLGVVSGRIFLWVQAQDIRRKDDDNDQRVKATAGIVG